MPPSVRQDGEGEQLASISVTSATRSSASWANKAYKFIYLEATTLTDLTLDRWAIHLTGSSSNT